MSTRILALDTATEACSVALWNNGEITSLYEICPREHTQRILPLVDQILIDSGLALADLNALAFGRGPGSFTGVRIGIGVAQGLALGAGLPMIGVSTLKTMAQGAWRVNHASRVLAAIDARMGEVYWGQYQRDEQGVWLDVAAEAVLSPEYVSSALSGLSGEWASVGTGWLTYPDMALGTAITLSDGGIELPHAQDMLPIALNSWQNGDMQSVEQTQPVYLRNEVTWKKLPGRE